MLTERQLLAELFDAIGHEGSAATFSDKHGLARSDVSKIANGHRPPTEAIANALGYVRVVRFHKLGDKTDG